MSNPENNLIVVQTHKEITRLYKNFLELIEDIRKDHDTMVKKIETKFGPEIAKDIDYFTNEKYEQIRKRVLDNGNETARQMINFLDFYDFQINTVKLEAAASKRKIVRKFTTSSPLMVIEG
jgi:hypothetical protein